MGLHSTLSATSMSALPAIAAAKIFLASVAEASLAIFALFQHIVFAKIDALFLPGS